MYLDDDLPILARKKLALQESQAPLAQPTTNAPEKVGGILGAILGGVAGGVMGSPGGPAGMALGALSGASAGQQAGSGIGQMAQGDIQKGAPNTLGAAARMYALYRSGEKDAQKAKNNQAPPAPPASPATSS